MFDASGRLLSEPSLATAQALCLLEMHEVAASHSWTKHYRYFGKFEITNSPINPALMAITSFTFPYRNSLPIDPLTLPSGRPRAPAAGRGPPHSQAGLPYPRSHLN